MNTVKTIAPHEIFELHELLTMKNISATKAGIMAGLVTDEELKALMHQDFQTSQQQIKELQDLIRLSEFAPSSGDKH